MGGCAVLILFWFCEKTKLISPISGRESEDIGMSKWCLQTMNQKLAEYKNLEKMKKLFKNLKKDKDDDSESEEEEEEEDSGEDYDSSSSSKMDDSMEDETVDIWLSQVSTQSENAAADYKEEESKKKNEESGCQTGQSDQRRDQTWQLLAN